VGRGGGGGDVGCTTSAAAGLATRHLPNAWQRRRHRRRPTQPSRIMASLRPRSTGGGAALLAAPPIGAVPDDETVTPMSGLPRSPPLSQPPGGGRGSAGADRAARGVTVTAMAAPMTRLQGWPGTVEPRGNACYCPSVIIAITSDQRESKSMHFALLESG